MTNTQYIEKILSSVELIFADTSTIMPRGFQQFISNNREQLLAKGKKILIPKAVYTELARHMGSEDERKSTYASNPAKVERFLSAISTATENSARPSIGSAAEQPVSSIPESSTISPNNVPKTNSEEVTEDTRKFDWFPVLLASQVQGLSTTSIEVAKHFFVILLNKEVKNERSDP